MAEERLHNKETIRLFYAAYPDSPIVHHLPNLFHYTCHAAVCSMQAGVQQMVNRRKEYTEERLRRLNEEVLQIQADKLLQKLCCIRDV